MQVKSIVKVCLTQDEILRDVIRFGRALACGKLHEEYSAFCEGYMLFRITKMMLIYL